jgi:hypothetical protein
MIAAWFQSVRQMQFVWPIPVIVLAIAWQGVRLKQMIIWLAPLLLCAAAILGLVLSRGRHATESELPFMVVWTGIVAACAFGAFLWATRHTKTRLTLAFMAGAGGVIGTIIAVIPAVLAVCVFTWNCP